MDRFETLKKYKELLDMGIITQEEFDEKKAILLNNDSENNTLPKISDKDRAVEASTIATAVDADVDETSKTDERVINDEGFSHNDTVVFTNETESNSKNVDKEKHSKVRKPALVGIVGIVALFVVILAFIAFPKNDAKEIQGSWNMVVITTDGQSSYPAGPIGGSLEIKGDKWTMEIHSLTQDSSWSGKVQLDSKQITSDGTEGFLYDFKNDDVGSLKAVYVPKNELLTVSTHSYMDTDNCATFKKSN